MIPILWRYLLRSYFQVLALCVSAFISVLLVIRFQEIARFATSGAAASKVLLFALLQIPYILPIALPISCLIAAILLFQRLSYTHELTALRTSGLRLKAITTPLLFAGAFLTLINFTIASELGPRCRSFSKGLIYEMAASNPLFLLQKESLIKLKSAYFDMKALHAGRRAEDVFLVIKNSSSGRLAVMSAKELALSGDFLKGKQVTFISSVDPKKGGGFDHLVIENQAEMDTEAAGLGQFIQTVDWTGSYEYLPLRMLLAREAAAKGSLSLGRSAQYELARRTSISLAAFTFTLIGIACGMQISRNRSKKGIIWAIALASLFMMCFVGAKTLRHTPALSTSMFLAPHALVIAISLLFLKKIRAGVE
ncbi:MAG: LptF/LptG family permease [Verrucomicrobia bacterium]|nr:LptF/LptG family permease [Verrucomicrobiota bacterium]